MVKGVLLLLKVLRTDSTFATDYVMEYSYEDSFWQWIKFMVMLSRLVLSFVLIIIMLLFERHACDYNHLVWSTECGCSYCGFLNNRGICCHLGKSIVWFCWFYTNMLMFLLVPCPYDYQSWWTFMFNRGRLMFSRGGYVMRLCSAGLQSGTRGAVCVCVVLQVPAIKTLPLMG